MGPSASCCPGLPQCMRPLVAHGEAGCAEGKLWWPPWPPQADPIRARPSGSARAPWLCPAGAPGPFLLTRGQREGGRERPLGSPRAGWQWQAGVGTAGAGAPLPSQARLSEPLQPPGKSLSEKPPRQDCKFLGARHWLRLHWEPAARRGGVVTLLRNASRPSATLGL